MHCKICGDWTCEKISSRKTLVCFNTEKDTNGFYHYHDQNEQWDTWKCSKGHEFECSGYYQCWCGWNRRFPDNIYHKTVPHDPINGYKFFRMGPVILNEKWIGNLKCEHQKSNNSEENSD